jgi:hypothetical protein
MATKLDVLVNLMGSFDGNAFCSIGRVIKTVIPNRLNASPVPILELSEAAGPEATAQALQCLRLLLPEWPMDASAIAARFRRTKSSVSTISDVLASLARLGHVSTKDGKSFEIRRTAYYRGHKPLSAGAHNLTAAVTTELRSAGITDDPIAPKNVVNANGHSGSAKIRSRAASKK